MRNRPPAIQSVQPERHGTASAGKLGCLTCTQSLADPIFLLGLSSRSTFYLGISDHLSLLHSPYIGVLVYFQRLCRKHNLFCIVTFLNMALLLFNVRRSDLSCINVPTLVPTACFLHQGWEVSVTSQKTASHATPGCHKRVKRIIQTPFWQHSFHPGDK